MNHPTSVFQEWNLNPIALKRNRHQAEQQKEIGVKENREMEWLQLGNLGSRGIFSSPVPGAG
jgi:hypothetical protein